MRFLATPAWVRATVVVVVAAVLAVCAARPDLLALAAPLLVWVGWAALSRPRDVGLTTTPGERVTAVEGTRIPLGIATDADRPLVVTAAWPDLDGADFDPPYGCGTDLVEPGGQQVVGVDTRRWGSVLLGPPKVSVLDVTGAWRANGHGGTVRATLRPEASTLHGPTGVARPVGVAGVHQSARRGEGSTLSDVRPFQAGDRLRRINWRATARRDGALHVTSTLTDRDTDVLVVADSIHDLNGPALDGPTTLDVVARAVVAISRYYTGLGDRVGVVDLGARIRPVPTGTGLKQARIITDVLSRARRGGAAGAVRLRVPRLVPGTLVFVCSPLLDDHAIDEIGRLRRLGGEVVVVDTLPPEMGETALSYARSDATSAEAWRLRWLEREEDVRRLRGAGIPVTAWRGATSLASVLLAMEAARTAPRRMVGG